MAKGYFIAATLMILQGLVFCFAQPIHFSNFCSFDNGTYNMSWMYNATSDKLYFVVEVTAVGWVGFGLASNAPTGMMGYDVAVGGVYNGTGYLKDYLTVGQVQPRLDTQQDWNLTYSSEVDNVTTLKFHRMRNTSDSNDTAVQQGESIYVIWAYHYTDDVNLTTWSFNQHSKSGVENKTLINATVSSTTSASSSTSADPSTNISPSPSSSVADPPTTSAIMSPSPSLSVADPSTNISPSPSSSVAGPSSISTTTPPKPTTSAPVHFPNFCPFDNGNYNMSWKCGTTCNGTEDQNWICFVVQVKATGWIGFGLANKAPNNMIDYDVAVGGVYDNGTCYLKDYYTTGRMQPTCNEEQDWVCCNCTQANNVTTLKFCRKLDTTDSNDIPIKPGMPKFIVWAYHCKDDIRPYCTFDKHTNKGFVEKLLKKETTTTPTPTPSASPKTPGIQVKMTLTVDIPCSGRVETLKVNLEVDVKNALIKAGFSTMSVETESSTCNSPLKITLVISFYTGIPTNITVEKVFEDALKAGQIRELTVANTVFSLNFPGVTISYTPKSGECDRVCCNGPGGKLTVEGSCSPTDKCAEIKPADKQETGHCPGESKDTCKCGSEGFHNSNFALIILLGIATFMKNSF